MRSDRNYSIDLLKCISMLMIINLHLGNYGLRDASYSPCGLLGIVNNLLNSFSIVGVNIFVLITGYFLSAKDISLNRGNLLRRYKRLLPLWIQVEVYSIGIYLLLCGIPQTGIVFNLKTLIKQALPLLTNQYWFFTVYFLLIIVSPFINRIILQTNAQEYRLLLSVCIAVFSVLPTISIFGESFATGYGYELIWFIVLYFIGGYIRNDELKDRRYHLLYLAFVAFVFVSRLLANFVPGAIGAVLNLASGTYTSVFVLGASVALFLVFLKSDHTYKKIGKGIASVASLSFAVYLIHEHNEFRDVLWKQIIELDKFVNNPAVCLMIMLISVVCIYVGGILTEYIRVKIESLLKLIICIIRRKGNNES